MRVLRFAHFAAIALLLYLAVAMMAFAFRHPHLTDTERLLRIADALLWR